MREYKTSPRVHQSFARNSILLRTRKGKTARPMLLSRLGPLWVGILFQQASWSFVATNNSLLSRKQFISSIHDTKQSFARHTVAKKAKPSTPKSTRHPPNYWSDMETIRTELLQFWQESLQIPIFPEEHNTPPIPNEFLLTFAKRYDLKYAINHVYGGREALAYALAYDGTMRAHTSKPCRIIGGQWYSDECIHTREVQFLYRHPVFGPKLQECKPYLTMNSDGKNSAIGTARTLSFSALGWKEFSGKQDRWRHQASRKSWGFWNATILETEL